MAGCCDCVVGRVYSCVRDCVPTGDWGLKCVGGRAHKQLCGVSSVCHWGPSMWSLIQVSECAAFGVYLYLSV